MAKFKYNPKNDAEAFALGVKLFKANVFMGIMDVDPKFHEAFGAGEEEAAKTHQFRAPRRRKAC